MKRSSVGIQKEPTIMIIPMIDIVFFLLVFFMMSTLYMNTEEQIPLNLPKASSSSAKTIEPIIVRAAEDIAYKDVINILDNLKISGARFVSVATERK